MYMVQDLKPDIVTMMTKQNLWFFIKDACTKTGSRVHDIYIQ